MSEEEIIEIVEKLMCIYKEQMNCNKYYNEIIEKSTRNFNGLQGLLDLYNKEKEKNKKLEIEITKNDYIDIDKLAENYRFYKNLAYEYQGNSISKDKLVELLKLDNIDVIHCKLKQFLEG